MARRRIGAPARPGAVLVIMNLPVPDDRRAWAQAEALRDGGAAVTVVCPAIRAKAPGTATVDGIDVVYFRSFEGAGKLGTVAEGLWTTAAASRAAKRTLSRLDGPRALQVGNPPDLLFRLSRWARRHGCLTVYDQRDVVPALAASRPGFDRLKGLFLACERRTVAAADVIVTPSEEQLERLRVLYGRDAIIVRTAAVEVKAASGGGRAPAERADEPATTDESGAARETVLGYLGVMGEQDGLGELLDAVHTLRERGVGGFRVQIAGDGPALAPARRQAERQGLDGLVRFLGWLGHGEVDAFLDGIDAMVVPDPDLEFNHYCAMNKVTHAMARGLPVVLRPLRENARLIGDSPYLAKDTSPAAFADAIEALLLATPHEWREVGERGRERFERELAWGTCAPQYVAAVLPGSRVPSAR